MQAEATAGPQRLCYGEPHIASTCLLAACCFSLVAQFPSLCYTSFCRQRENITRWWKQRLCWKQKMRSCSRNTLRSLGELSQDAPLVLGLLDVNTYRSHTYTSDTTRPCRSCTCSDQGRLITAWSIDDPHLDLIHQSLSSL